MSPVAGMTEVLTGAMPQHEVTTVNPEVFGAEDRVSAENQNLPKSLGIHDLGGVGPVSFARSYYQMTGLWGRFGGVDRLLGGMLMIAIIDYPVVRWFG